LLPPSLVRQRPLLALLSHSPIDAQGPTSRASLSLSTLPMVRLTSAFSALSLALAFTSALAERDSHVHLRVHSRSQRHHQKVDAECEDGGQSVSVVSWPEAACIGADEQMCVADVYDGACPDGATCAPVAYTSDYSDFVYGCVPAEWYYWEDDSAPTTADCSGDDESPMSVVGWTAVSCVSGDACVATNSAGACPEDAVCDLVTYDASDNPVYGCYATNLTSSDDSDDWEDDSEETTAAPTDAPTDDSDDDSDAWTGCADGEQTIGVMGWTHDGCVAEGADVCVAKVSDGVCPDGAMCTVVNQNADGDVYGCADAGRRHHHHHKQQKRRGDKKHQQQTKKHHAKKTHHHHA
jgi:hypothetical protein